VVAEAVLLVTRVVIGGMFLVALAGKLRDPAAFRLALRGFRVVPRHLERPAASAVLAAEAAVVLLLTARASAPIGLALAVLLLAAFTAGTARVVARGDRVPCGCFGRSSAPIGRAHVARNALLAVAGAAGAVAGLAPGAGELDGPALLVLSLFALAVVAVLLLADQVLAAPAAPEPRRLRPPAGTPPAGTTRKR
jgi:hypothetical protein